MKILFLLILSLFLTGCGAAPIPETAQPPSLPAESVETTLPETRPGDPLDALLETMSLREKVGQLFLARCNDASALEDIAKYHLGGFVLFGADFQDQTPDSMREKLSAYQAAADIPLLLAVDEEGGTVNRISRYPAFRSSPLPSPRNAFRDGGMEGALENEEEKCLLLSSLGLNVNLGPVCDIATSPDAFMYQRSLGQDAKTTGEFVARTVDLMDAYRIGSCLKHFPGYGSNADTHVGIARDSRTLEELERNDLVPFAAGIHADAILVSHTVVEALDPERPASLSWEVHWYLRDTLGFEGVIVTDDLVMEAITEQYGAGEAAVLAVLAGNDLLCSTDYAVQYDAVLAAVEEGRIDIRQLDKAVRRVLEWKLKLGLI